MKGDGGGGRIGDGLELNGGGLPGCKDGASSTESDFEKVRSVFEPYK
jgi:hypothetical protein